MPTDGADFGRTRPCYGKAYVMARDSAADVEIAGCTMRGVEMDIRRDGGAPLFPAVVEALVSATASGNGGQLLAAVDGLKSKFSDFPLTRLFAAASEKVGLSAIADGHALSQREAAEKLLVEFASSRCCDGMAGYLTRNRTKNLSASLAIVESIKSELGRAAPDLADRMLRCSPKGFPARAPKTAPVDHSPKGLDEEL